MAETYRQLNEPERALVVLQSLADTYSPGDEPQQVLYLEGLASRRTGRYDDAVRHLSLAAHREQPTADILCHLAEAELLSGRGSRRRGRLQQALALAPDHPASRQLAVRLAGRASRHGHEHPVVRHVRPRIRRDKRYIPDPHASAAATSRAAWGSSAFAACSSEISDLGFVSHGQ